MIPVPPRPLVEFYEWTEEERQEYAVAWGLHPDGVPGMLEQLGDAGISLDDVPFDEMVGLLEAQLRRLYRMKEDRDEIRRRISEYEA